MSVKLLIFLNLSIAGALKLATTASKSKETPTGELGNALQDSAIADGTPGKKGEPGVPGKSGESGKNNGWWKPATGGKPGTAGKPGVKGTPGKKGFSCISEKGSYADGKNPMGWDNKRKTVCERCNLYAVHYAIAKVKDACWNCACDCGTRICGCYWCKEITTTTSHFNTGTTTTTTSTMCSDLICFSNHCDPCVFVVDESGSMKRSIKNECIVTLYEKKHDVVDVVRRQASRIELKRQLNDLPYYVQFHIVAFSGAHASFTSVMGQVPAERIKDALAFVDGYTERGGTFLGPALHKAHSVLDGGPTADAKITLISDGDPDCGPDHKAHDDDRDDGKDYEKYVFPEGHPDYVAGSTEYEYHGQNCGWESRNQIDTAIGNQNMCQNVEKTTNYMHNERYTPGCGWSVNLGHIVPIDVFMIGNQGNDVLKDWLQTLQTNSLGTWLNPEAFGNWDDSDITIDDDKCKEIKDL